MGGRVSELLETFSRGPVRVGEALCDSHPAESVAFVLVDGELEHSEISYGELAASSRRFAQVLADRGIGPGDRIAILLPKCAELLTVLVGAWRRGVTVVPLFTAFAEPEVRYRCNSARVKMILTNEKHASKVDLALLHDGVEVLVCGVENASTFGSFDAAMSSSSLRPVADFDASPGHPLICLYTSGTTGRPKGVLVPVRALASMQAYLEFGLDVRTDDVYWNAADPGWAYGLFYGITAPLCAGLTSLLLTEGFSPELTFAVMSKFGVTNFAAAPTVYRALQASGAAPNRPGTLRVASSAGEPLGSNALRWSQEVLGLVIRDHYGQTELGMCVANAHNAMLGQEARPDSMGRELPGWSVAILDPETGDSNLEVTDGELAIAVDASPLMWFTGYDQDPEHTAAKFSGDRKWYLTGDLASRGQDGYFSFKARADDLIIMAGYRLGPEEIEDVLIRHPAVREAAVVAIQDDLRGEVVTAYVVPAAGVEVGPDLEAELKTWVKESFAAHAYPRIVRFVSDLPRTASGKLQRKALR
ncbi:MAG: AMP-binding protein [bacterium]|nr:AMP-binding protein [bacterium]